MLFEQSDIMIRTFGIERYIQAIKNRMINILVTQNEGKSRQKIVKMLENDFNDNNYSQVIRKAFQQSSRAPRIDINSAEGKHAMSYIEVLENYVQPSNNGFLLTISKDYLKNALEVEAYKTGNSIGRKMWLLEQLNLTQV